MIHVHPSFFYTVNYRDSEFDLCRLEIKSLFQLEPDKKYFFSDIDFDVSRSPFIKEKISVVYAAESFEELLQCLQKEPYNAEQFKIIFVRPEQSSFGYQARLAAMGQVGAFITGFANVKNPQVLLGLTEIEGKWLFGIYEKNDCLWHKHNEKPNTYSHSLEFRVARALVNMAVGSNLSATLIDPCCGVGTVLLEALSMGIPAYGVEINPLVAQKARENLLYFDYPDVIQLGDMHMIQAHFYAAIVDIPYGILTPITKKEQQAILKTARKISDRLVLVTFENMDTEIQQAGFSISDRGIVTKGSFVRYVHICI